MDQERFARYLRVGGAVLIAICIVWWIIDFSGYMKRDGVGAAFGCLLSGNEKCKVVQATLASRGGGGTGAYEPFLMWIAIVVFAAGYILPKLAAANVPGGDGPAGPGGAGSGFRAPTDIPGAMPATSFAPSFTSNTILECPQARIARLGDRYLVSDPEGEGYEAFESKDVVVAELDRRGASQETIDSFRAKA